MSQINYPEVRRGIRWGKLQGWMRGQIVQLTINMEVFSRHQEASVLAAFEPNFIQHGREKHCERQKETERQRDEETERQRDKQERGRHRETGERQRTKTTVKQRVAEENGVGGLFGNGWCAGIPKKERKQEQRMNTVSIVLI